MSTKYLEQLTIRLSTGVAALPEDVRVLHAAYLKSEQREDGGFAGREGESDLYYTSFALRSLSILGELYGPLAESSAAFLKTKLAGQETIVDFLSLVYSAGLLDASAGLDVFAEATANWRQLVADELNLLRRDDGGYAKSPQGAASSTYHTFLVLLCLELIDVPLPDPEKTVAFVLSQQVDEGGFREIRASKRAGANPTAAAIGILRILDALDAEICEDTLDFLLEMQTDEGGLRANTRIPIADLLSTFTGMMTIADLGGFEELQKAEAERYVNSLVVEGGGFRGASLDPSRDVEYTFYGLGALALLRGAA